MPKKVQVNAYEFQSVIRAPQNTVKVIQDILEELERAEDKHPDWPTDPVYAAAIVGEESGELVREALHLNFENGNISLVAKEAVQTAVTAIRFLKNLHRYREYGSAKIITLTWTDFLEESRSCSVALDGLDLYHYYEEISADREDWFLAKENGFATAAAFFDKYDRDCVLYLKGWKVEQCIWADPES